MIRKSYVIKRFVTALTAQFSESSACNWVNLYLQNFRNVIFAKIFQKIFGAHPVRLSLQSFKIQQNFIFSELFSKIDEKCVKMLQKFVATFWNMCKSDKRNIFYIIEYTCRSLVLVYDFEVLHVDGKNLISKYVVKPHVLEQKKHAVSQRTFKR